MGPVCATYSCLRLLLVARRGKITHFQMRLSRDERGLVGPCVYFWAYTMTRSTTPVADSPLLPISEFVLDEKFQQNASKFAIFYIYENPRLLFLFFIS